LGAILIGSTFSNILASSAATLIAERLFGNTGVMVATILLGLIILMFAEIMPKTLAALYPEQVSFIISLPLKLFLKCFYPLVWIANTIANNTLRIFGVEINKRESDALSRDELRAVLAASSGRISPSHQGMLLSILDLEKVTVNNVMVPRNEIIGIDLNQDWPLILEKLKHIEHTHILIYRDTLDQVEGWLNLRKVLNLLIQEKFNKESLIKYKEEICFIPEGTLLSVQLLNFQTQKYRIGLVADEYGDVEGLVTSEDILREIVGEFCTDVVIGGKDIRLAREGGYLVAGNITVRDLNRNMGWDLPLTGPKTMSGLIVEHLEILPRSGVGLRLAGYPIEVISVKNKRVEVARIIPNLRKPAVPNEHLNE
jgi:Mg2+/Co2+ transporter CorB